MMSAKKLKTVLKLVKEFNKGNLALVMQKQAKINGSTIKKKLEIIKKFFKDYDESNSQK